MQETLTRQDTRVADFNAIRISIASPEDVYNWSYGEVTKPETINYRTQKPERDGLFDERIFGPIKDWECYCGKYKKIRYKGVICDKCGVEVTRAAVRRERMGHIELAVPVAHVWFVRSVPSILGLALNLSVNDLEKVIYFAGFIVLAVDETIRTEALSQLENEYRELRGRLKNNHATAKPDLKQSTPLTELEGMYRTTKNEITSLAKYKIITEQRYHEISLKYGSIIKVGIGAEAFHQLLKDIDFVEVVRNLEKEVENSQGSQRRRILKRIRVLKDMLKAKIDPKWLITTRLPVIPPDLRPMVQLDGGRFAASDLNDLYRRVINRNNRLKKLISLGAPDVICRNEKRMLQEAVDALIDNSVRRGKAVSTTAAQRKLRSLSDMLRGKQGRFRQNLLGKRVDYSGRSVIVVGPNLKLHQCGLPKGMALELFKPFVISKMISEGYVHNVKNATRLIERATPEVWDILERITSEQYVLLNRAPTLHRLGIQAFQPVLIEGKAIQLHPLVCYAFNADFDGDQMAVHVPLSKQAHIEARDIMLSTKNVLKPASGEPVITPRLDIVFGCYYLTTIEDGVKGNGRTFASSDEAMLAYQNGQLHVRASIKVRLEDGFITKENSPDPEVKAGDLVETSIGRIILNAILPKSARFRNYAMDSKSLRELVEHIFKTEGAEATTTVSDEIKKVGFRHATLSGMTISISDINVPAKKSEIIKATDLLVEEIEMQYRRGLITNHERRLKIIEQWTSARAKIEKEMLALFNLHNPVNVMMLSGARGSVTQVTQLGGMKGLVVNPAGEIIELPIKSNYREGLSVFEYFISTHGARKGKSDTSLRTSDAGYLTRRLVDVSQDMVVALEDCGTKEGLRFHADPKHFRHLIDRVTVKPIMLARKTIVPANTLISEERLRQLNTNEPFDVIVRSILYCQARWGVCQNCYGRDLATGEMVKHGEAVGIMAAQAIGEPGTQLTMKTFHSGGVVGEDITSGLPRVEELFEARTPQNPATLAQIAGTVKIFTEKGRRTLQIVTNQKMEEVYEIPEGYEITVKNGAPVVAKQILGNAKDAKAIRTKIPGTVRVKERQIKVISSEFTSISFPLRANETVLVKDGDVVGIGQQLTDGHFDLGESLKFRGRVATQAYIINDVLSIYSSQGQTINPKHIEMIVRQMFSKVRVTDEGDSEFLPGQIIDSLHAGIVNAELTKKGRRLVQVEDVVMGITRVSLKTQSFLSAASFQETTGVLIEAAARGAVDHLNGMKENVIIGKLIPAGTGFDPSSARKKAIHGTR